MFCKSCGKQQSDGMEYCEFCGTKLGQTQKKTEPVINYTNSANQPTNSVKKPMQPSISKGKAIGLIAGLVVIVLIVFILSQSSNKPKDTETENDSYASQELQSGQTQALEGSGMADAAEGDVTQSDTQASETPDAKAGETVDAQAGETANGQGDTTAETATTELKASYTADELPNGTFVMQGENFILLNDCKSLNRNSPIKESGYQQFGGDYIWLNGNENPGNYIQTIAKGSTLAIKGDDFSPDEQLKMLQGEYGLTFRYGECSNSLVDLLGEESSIAVEYVNGEEILLPNYAEREGWKKVYSAPQMTYYNIYFHDFQMGDAIKVGRYEGSSFVEEEIGVSLWVAIFQEFSEADTTFAINTVVTPNGYFTIQLPSEMPQGLYEMQSPANFFPIYVFIE